MSEQRTQQTLAEHMVDTELAEISMRDIASRLFLRPKLLLFMLLTPPLIAMMLSAMVPVEWVASTKVLIRYSASDAALLKDLVPDARLGLSGATSAELIKSDPVIEKTIRHVGIVADDIYHKPTDIIMGKLLGMLKAPFAKNEHETSSTTDQQTQMTQLVKSFQASLESSSKKSGSQKAIEILEKTSTVPESMKLDELITIQVKSFSREKVAQMSNGLVEAFIDEYYRIYADEATRQFQYLDQLVIQEESELKALELATPADFNDGRVRSTSGRELISRDVPILTSMANELMAAESALLKARQIYAGKAPQVARLASQVANLKFQLTKQERIEISKQQLEQLKTKRYQAANTQKIYQERLVPISIAELATTPQASGTKKISRVIVSGVIGSILGVMMSIGLMIVLNVLDPRIHFARDIEKVSAYPVVASVPLLTDLRPTHLASMRANTRLEQAMLSLVARIGRRENPSVGKVIVMTSVGLGDGATTTGLSLAMTLAKNKSDKVCLIDADFSEHSLTEWLGLGQTTGLIDVLTLQHQDLAPQLHDQEALRLTVLGVGTLKQRSELGYYAEHAKALISTLQQQFTYIVIDAGEVFKSNELTIFGALADEVFAIVSSGQSRKGKLKAAITQMEKSAVPVAGVILNKATNVLPKFIYNSL